MRQTTLDRSIAEPSTVSLWPRDVGGNKKSMIGVTQDGRIAQVWDTDAWNTDFPAESAGHPALRFNLIALWPRNVANNRKSIFGLTNDGRIAQISDANGWSLDFPAESTGNAADAALRFRSLCVWARNNAENKKSIFGLTGDGRIAQIWDDAAWHLDFPAESTGSAADAALRFTDFVAWGRDAVANKKSLFARVSDGRLAQISDAAGWHLDFPAGALRFRA